MGWLKYLGLRLLGLCLVLLAMETLYLHTFWDADISEYGHVLENVLNLPKETEVIYFGESSNFHTLPEGAKLHRISDELDSLLPDIKVKDVDNSGLHAGTYLALMKNIPSDLNVKAIVVTFNYRSFGPLWVYSQFESYLSRMETMIQPELASWNRFLISLKAYDLKSDQQRKEQYMNYWANDHLDLPNVEYDNVRQWDSATAWGQYLKTLPAQNKENLGVACHFIKNYAYNIPEDHIRLQQFDRLVEFCKANGYPLIFNILPENLERAKAMAGEDLTGLMNRNKTMLIERYKGMGVTVVDNMNLLPDSAFVDRHYPTEHYSEWGKTQVAQTLVDPVKAIINRP